MSDDRPDDAASAVELIRNKIKTLYAAEPDAKAEAAEAKAVQPRSTHQQFMYDLSTSGKSLAEIQTAWHNYYVNLPDNEKHIVWQEFYANQGQPGQHPAVHHQPMAHHVTPRPGRPRNVAEVKEQILRAVGTSANISTKRKHQLKSLAFGLSMGCLVTLVLLFSFFNERFIAPFITPSRAVSATPIITEVNPSEEKVSKEAVIIVPKINIEIPVVYDEPSIDEKAVQRALERGVLHYPTTSNPGEEGNAVFFGHSAVNILTNGKYKFAFVLLHRLEKGDTFMLQRDRKRYIYKVIERKIVKPTDVSVLEDLDRPTATLITCDPPGSNTNRLVVIGEQISPDPTRNIASSAPKENVATPQILPSDSPSLWSRLWGWLKS